VTSRPRAPGRNRPLGERLRGNHQQLLLVGLVAGAALIVASTLAALAWNARTTTTSNADADGNPSTAGDDGTDSSGQLVLPLGLADVGFEGTVEEVAPEEGPAAISYCNNRPVTDGMTGWTGNLLTETDGRRRVVQTVSRFRSSVDAAAFVASNSTIVDCETWDTVGDGTPVTLTVAELTPETVHGDETKQFDLSAATSGPDLFLRVILARSGRDVIQITYVSANRQDLEDTDRLVALAAETSGF
jgi:hypothetical protein